VLAYNCGHFGGHIVAVKHWAAPKPKGKGKDPSMGECREIQKMKNSGNEAKKWLKTKHITFFKCANYARFAHESAQIMR
jgi:hypothetical protein